MEALSRLQAALDAHEEPEDWPADVCRDASCGHWERSGGLYFWHTPADHTPADHPAP